MGIAIVIKWLIRSDVNVRRNNVAKLHAHCKHQQGTPYIQAARPYCCKLQQKQTESSPNWNLWMPTHCLRVSACYGFRLSTYTMIAWQYGQLSNVVINAYVGHGSTKVPFQNLRAMMQGSVHIACSIEIKARSLTRSLSHVIPRSVKVPKTAFGIVRRLVVNCFSLAISFNATQKTFYLTGLNPSSRSDNVKQVPGGDCGMYAIKPMAYIFENIVSICKNT